MEFLAVEGLTISHKSGSPISGGTFTVTSVSSLKCKADGKGVYSSVLNFTFTGGTHASGTSGSATGDGSISFTSTKNKVEGSFVIREGDDGKMTGAYVPPSVPPPTVTFTSDVEITDAGQNKVRGE